MKIGEVIETSTTHFTGQAYCYNDVPAFGSFVETTADGGTVTGVVTEVKTQTIDPTRKPMALGDAQSSLEDTLQEHPQLNRLIHTYFTVRVTHVNGEYTVPAKPPHLHEGITLCTDADAKKLLTTFGYVSSLLDAPDDVLAMHLTYIGSLDKTALSEACQRMSILLKDDYQRLQRVLRTAEA